MITTLDENALPLVLDFRHRMMVEASISHLLADDWRELTQEFYAREYRNGACAHFGWQEDGRVVATAGALIRDNFPIFTFKTRRQGWIMDVYVLPEYRRRGLARRLTARTLEWLHDHGVLTARLTASPEAKKAGLYERMGFTFTNDMMIQLDDKPTPPPVSPAS